MSFLHVVGSLDVIAAFFSVEDGVVDNVFACAFLFKELDVDDVALDALLCIVLLDAEHDVLADRFKIHSLDGRMLLSRMLLSKLLSFFVVELLVELLFI